MPVQIILMGNILHFLCQLFHGLKDLKELLLQDTFGTMSQLALAKKPIAADDTTPNIVPALPPQQILLQCRGGPVMGDRLR